MDDPSPLPDPESVDPTEIIEPQSFQPSDPQDELNANDVLSGRGAFVNANPGNKKFRALCFAKKNLFEASNHAAKRRIATDIVETMIQNFASRFLKRKNDKEPWEEMTKEQAILKACQVMRDHKRPDRLVKRELSASDGKKRNRATATPMENVNVVEPPAEPLVENPFGVNDHDVLSGRGAFVNGHVGNALLRKLAIERKSQFDRSSYSEKRALAAEIVGYIRSLDPPGRFLRRVDSSKVDKNDMGSYIVSDEIEGIMWEELADDKAIHKACQVMRDIDRPDRKQREERSRLRKLRKAGKVATREEPLFPESTGHEGVEEAVAAAAVEVLDQADGVYKTDSSTYLLHAPLDSEEIV